MLLGIGLGVLMAGCSAASETTSSLGSPQPRWETVRNAVPMPQLSEAADPTVRSQPYHIPTMRPSQAFVGLETWETTEHRSRRTAARRGRHTKRTASASQALVRGTIPPGSGDIVVARGDTLSALSRRYGVSVADLKQANGLSSDLIRQGQSLRLPPR
ncbi:MAG: LysM peptidoglycan-binding domain-containing protein [Hyphomicrobiaceae bacterium]